ncbi:MAG TPA: hypothetical protein VFS43_20870 [Polyangiaceae bacterium]|nr:hypothetical protein [Polyangiaceae bacterium]
MTEVRPGNLAAEGFMRYTLLPSALAHWMWSVEFVSEQDRRLRVVDEAVLRLVDAGIADPDRIATLMGVDESDIVPSSIANLMRAGALQHDAGIRITPGGRSALERVALREPTRESVQLHFDPYRSCVALAGGRDTFLSTTEMRSRGLHELPIPPAPSERELRAKHLQIQGSFEASLRAKGAMGAVDLLRMVPAGEPIIVFEDVDLEVWHRLSDRSWRWRLLRESADDAAASAMLRTLEDEGADVLPFVPPCDSAKTSKLDRRLSKIFLSSPEAENGARSDAISDAKAVTVLLPPYSAGYADLALLLHVASLEPETAARASVVFGSTTTTASGAPDPLRQVVDLIGRRGVRVAHVGDALHHGALCCDGHGFVMRYHVEAVDERRERGVPCVEVRTVSGDAVTELRELLASVATPRGR